MSDGGENAAGSITEDGTMREILPRCSAWLSFSHGPMRMVSCRLAKLLNQEEAQGNAATRFSVHTRAASASPPLTGGGVGGPL
jgi:hypothetical protein